MASVTRAEIQAFAQKYHFITLAKHQLRWISFLLKRGKRKILLAPRGHGKTMTVNEIYISKLLVDDPSLHILIVSHSKEQATEFSRTLRGFFEREDVKEDFNIETITPWRENSWTLGASKGNKPTVRCVGVRGKMTGWRGDIVIFDDVLEITMMSEAMRIKTKSWIDSEVLPAINPGKKEKVIVVGTRKHIDDWYGGLLKMSSYQKKVDKAIRANGTLLWPRDERKNLGFSKEILADRKEEMGVLKFNQEYQNEPSPPEGLEFKYEWLKFFEHLPNHAFMKYYVGIDPSHGSKQKRATFYSYCVVGHDTIKNKIYVVEMFRSKLSQEEQVVKSRNLLNRYKVEKIFVEKVFAYTHVYDALRKEFRNVYPIDYVHQKIKGTAVLNKLERIKNVCAPSIEKGRILFRRPDLDIFTKIFLDYEFVAFPLGDTDMFDALTLAIHDIVGRKVITEVPFFFPG